MKKSIRSLLVFLLTFTLFFSADYIVYGNTEENIDVVKEAQERNVDKVDNIQESDLQDAEYYKNYHNTDNSDEMYSSNMTESQQNNDFYDDNNTLAKAANGVLGCDVSKWQGNINWTQAKNAGIQYAFIRVGYRGRTDGVIRLDPNFKTNIENAEKAGIKVGVYFYSEAINEREAVEEADTLISNTYMYNVSMPMVIDYEGFNKDERVGQANLSKTVCTSIVSAFCEKIKSVGYTPMVYASASYFTNYLEGEYLSNAYCIWSAAYSNSPEHYNSVKYDFWQFASSANASQYGMEPGSLDLDYWYPGRTIIGNDYSLVFDANYYYNMYPDLQRAIGNNPTELLFHFLNHGMAEGRVACESFDVLSYKARYEDLQTAFDNNLKAYYMHYLTRKQYEQYRDGTPIKYKVTFISNGNVVKTESVSYGRAATPTDISMPGYSFANWDKDFKCVTSDMTVTAKWSPAKYTVKYDATGGKTNSPSKQVTYQGVYGDLETPVRTGYTFNGWFTAKTGGNEINKDTKVEITSNQTIYAHWTANRYNIKYDTKGGTVNSDGKAVTFGAAYGDLPTPERAGYTFMGWWLDSSSEGKVDSNTIVDIASDHILYAHWQVNSVSIMYKAHVQNIGWQQVVSNGQMAGTVGRGLQVEALNVKLTSKEDLGLIYSTHVQDYGWMNNSFNGETSGTVGQSKRVEAVMMKLTGSAASKYDIYYRVHSQNIGWLGWAKNGQPSGTAGLSYRVEAIQIEVIPKGDAAPSASYGGYNQNDARAFIQKSGSTPSLNTNISVEYQTHVQYIGWQAGKKDGQLSGTTGRSLRLEGLKINLNHQPYSGGIKYSTHVQNIGWQNDVQNGQLSGTTGKSLRLEAMKISLTGEIAKHYDVYYRVHAQNYGWLGWAKNGEAAGTSGKSLRLEGMQIVLVKKGDSAPKASYNGGVSNKDKAFY